MTTKDISFIVPVYNRPDETNELLESMVDLEGDNVFEVVIVEDGSTETSESVIQKYSNKLNISYFFKPNSGPGDSRNFGMEQAIGNYFIILDSDCILPKTYLTEVLDNLDKDYVDCFGGPDAAHESFTNIQKAINFAMTSFISTGGIRGKKNSVDEFQPRSFNMGISKKAFKATKGFGNIHPGEDPDLSIRLTKLGFRTKLIENAYVYHKRRISWKKFYNQVHKFGLVRPILNVWHPETRKITYWFPSIFIIGFIISIALAFFKIYWLIILYLIYFILGLILALLKTKSFFVSILSLFAISIQFFGYGFGFLKSTIKLMMSTKNIKKRFPNLFFKVN